MIFKALSTNTLVNHPAYARILTQYNDLLAKKGKVNNKKFYEEIILPEIPTYNIQSWYYFLGRFKTVSGLAAAEVVPPADLQKKEDVSNELIGTMMTNQEATVKLIQLALNISAARAQKIMENPHLLSHKEAIDLGLKAMKAQDSRIHAVGKLREDTREQEKFERAFGNAAYDQ